MLFTTTLASLLALQPPSTAEEPPPPPPESTTELAVDEPFARAGLTVAAGAGVWSCASAECALFPLGGLGQLQFGYRHRYISVMGQLSYGGGAVEVPPVEEEGFTIAGLDGDVRRLDVGLGVQFFPVTQGRWDPFVGVGLGYVSHRTRLSTEGEDGTLLLSNSTGGFTVSGGLPIYVARRVSVGPRVAWTTPFAGETCSRTEGAGDGLQECTKVSKTFEGLDPYETRVARRQLVRPWSVTLDVRFVF